MDPEKYPDAVFNLEFDTGIIQMDNCLVIPLEKAKALGILELITRTG